MSFKYMYTFWETLPASSVDVYFYDPDSGEDGDEHMETHGPHMPAFTVGGSESYLMLLPDGEPDPEFEPGQHCIVPEEDDPDTGFFDCWIDEPMITQDNLHLVRQAIAQTLCCKPDQIDIRCMNMLSVVEIS